MVESTTVIVAIAIFSIPTTTVAVLTFMQGRQIHMLVNSNLTRVKKELAAAIERIDSMQDTIDALLKELKAARDAAKGGVS